MALVLAAMIGVTSGIAVAADAPPSAAPNSGAAAADGAAAPAAPVPPPAAPLEGAPPSGAPAPAALPAAPQPPVAAAATVDLSAPQPETAQKQPITSKWWFWTAIGAAVVGGVVAIYLVERTPSPPSCPSAMGYVCPR